MASNIKISSLGASAGKNIATQTISGSDMANTFLTGSISGFRDMPTTPGTLTGTSPRPLGQQYEFYEFDGKLPTISITSLTTPDITNVNTGKQITFVYDISGIQSGETGVIRVYINGNDTGTTYNFSTNATGTTQTFTDSSNTYIVPNSTNTLKLVLTINSSTKTANDSKTVFVNPLDLTITSITQTPNLSGAGTYNYTTGSIVFAASVAGGISPYFYNWNGSGYTSNTSLTFNNAATTTDTLISLVVKDSNTPTADTATGTGLPTMRRPISVTASNNTTPEPYVSNQLSSTVNYNVEPLTITYLWALDSGGNFSSGYSSADASPYVYYSTVGSSITSRLTISNSSNNSVKNFTTVTATPAMVSPSLSATYTTSTQKFAVSVTARPAGVSGTTLKYDIDYAVRDSSGAYGAWTSMVANGVTITPDVSIAGKTANAQYAKARVRARRTDTVNEYFSGYTETDEVLIAQKGIITFSALYSDLLTGGNRTFTGTVQIGGVNDNSFSVSSVTAVTTDSTVTASGAKTASGVITITVNNPATSANDGTASHVVTIVDGNGYTITTSFNTQYKINSTQIVLASSWTTGRNYVDGLIVISKSLATAFTYDNFQYKVGSGGTYANLNSGTYTTSHSGWTAPTADETWYYHVKASGGTYTKSDFSETSVTVYGYVNQGYGYTLTSNISSGTLSQVASVVFSVTRSSGNFTKISANLTAYFPNLNTAGTDAKTDAAITDTLTSFDFTAISLNDGNCNTSTLGTAYGSVYLTYTISAGLYYYHFLTNKNVTVNRENSSVSATAGTGFVGAYAIRGINFTVDVAFYTYGPPLTTSNGGYWYAFLDNSAWPNQSAPYQLTKSVTFDTANGFLRTTTLNSPCQRLFSRSKTLSTNTIGTYSTTFRGIEYTYTGPSGGNYTYSASASDPNGLLNGTTGVFSTNVRGRRADTIGGTQTAVKYKGTTTIYLLNSGTWLSNITGPDGTLDISYDGFSYNSQYSSDNSTWTNLAAGIDYYNPGTFGTTYFRKKITDDWGTDVYSTSFSITTEDFDYTFTLPTPFSIQGIYAYQGPTYTPTRILNLDTYTGQTGGTFSTNSSTITFDNLNVSTKALSYMHQVSSMDNNYTYGSFPGAYTTMTVTVSSGTAPTSGFGMFRLFQNTYNGLYETYDNSSPFQGEGALDKTSFQLFNTGDTGGNALPYTNGNYYLAARFISSPTLGVTTTYRIHGQKSSTDTSQATDYYVVLKNRAAVNSLTFVSKVLICSGVTVTYRLGQIDTATKIVIEKSTDNSTWTDAQTWTSATANTNYAVFITIGNAVTMYFRAKIYDASDNLLATTSSDNSTAYTAGAPGNVSSTVSPSTTCNYIRWSASRPSGGDANSNAYYYIQWYTCGTYNTYTALGAATQCTYGTIYDTTISISGVACDTPMMYTIYAVSSTGCVSDTTQTDCAIYKYAAFPCDCTVAACLAYGTKILMYDGSEKLVEDLENGDLLKNYDIDGFSDEENAWLDFETNDFQYSESMTSIKTLIKDVYYYYYSVNDGELKITFEHPVFCKINDIFKFVRTEDLQIGYELFDINKGWINIQSIERIDELTPVVSIDVTANNTYFANNLLIHNVGGPVQK